MQEKEKDTSVDNNILLPLLLAVFGGTSFGGTSSSNTMLEKEIAYLRGKTDILENFITHNK